MWTVIGIIFVLFAYCFETLWYSFVYKLFVGTSVRYYIAALYGIVLCWYDVCVIKSYLESLIIKPHQTFEYGLRLIIKHVFVWDFCCICLYILLIVLLFGSSFGLRDLWYLFIVFWSHVIYVCLLIFVLLFDFDSLCIRTSWLFLIWVYLTTFCN